MTGRETSEELERAMRVALALAARGPAADPNPQVGCVILDTEGTIIAEGWHRGHGTPHAEVDALTKLNGRALGATAVVTLEPCNHTGHTGPCSEALIAAGVSRVVYAVSDPNPPADGGAERLASAGVEVIGGVLADEAEDLIAAWLTTMRLGRPHVTLKWASSLDGRAAAADGSSQWITGPAARAHVHQERAKADAILVGTGTVLSDDPSLTARSDVGELMDRQPTPVIVGLRSVPAGAKLLSHPKPLIETGTRDLNEVLRLLFDRGIRRVLVEGGPTLASAFVAAELVDEYLIYLAPTLLGGDRLALGDLGIGTLAEARRLKILGLERIGDDIIVRARSFDPPASGLLNQRRTSELLRHPDSEER